MQETIIIVYRYRRMFIDQYEENVYISSDTILIQLSVEP